MNWQHLTDINQITDIVKSSFNQPDGIQAVLIFKHSTRCSISSMALSRLESKWIANPKIPTFYLDLIKYREISNEIAETFHVVHQSPQVLVIKESKCFYNASHSAINVGDILAAITKQNQ